MEHLNRDDFLLDPPEPEYVGFWPRAGAAIVDALIIIAITEPILIAIHGWDEYLGNDSMVVVPEDLLISWLLPAVGTILLWKYRGTTPGKALVKARIVDATTGEAPKTWQLVMRYLGYFASTIPLGLGYIWVAIDDRKQGWHDKIAGTVVVRVGD